MPSNRKISSSFGHSCGLPTMLSVGASLGITPEGVRLVEGRVIGKLREAVQSVDVSREDGGVMFMRALRDAYVQRQADELLSDRIAAEASALMAADRSLTAEQAISKASAAIFSPHG